MKILLVSEPMREGVGRHVVDIACGLKRRGHDVHLLYSPRRLDEEFRQRLEAEPGLQIQPVLMDRAPGLGDLAAFGAIRRYLGRHGPFDVLHAHSSKAGALVRLAALGRRSGAPGGGRGRVVYTPHAFVTMARDEFGPIRLGIFSLIERLLSLVTDRLICTAGIEKDHARDVIGIAERRLVVVHNSVAVDDFRTTSDLRVELGLPADAKLIGFVGRLDIQKGADIALDAMPAVLAARPDARLVLMGAGSQDEALRARARTLGIEGSVHFMGRMKAREYFHNFDVVVCPSRYDGFAYTPIEALYCGVPLVCTPVGAVPEVIEDGETGLLVPIEDATATASAILRLIDDEALNRRIREAARGLGLRYTVDGMLDRLIAVYDDAAAPIAELPAKTVPAP